MTLRLKLQGTVVVHRARSVTIEESVRLSSENIVRYYISIEKKRSDFNTIISQKDRCSGFAAEVGSTPLGGGDGGGNLGGGFGGGGGVRIEEE